MDVNTRENQVVAEAIQNAPARRVTIGQAGELSVRVVHRIRKKVENHPDHVGREISIKIEMSGRDAGDGPQKRDRVRSEPDTSEKLRQAKADFAVEMEVEESFNFPRFVSCLDISPNDLIGHFDGHAESQN